MALLGSSPLLAQTFIAPAEYEQVDKNGVDLLSGSATLSITLGSIGSGDGELSYTDYWSSGPVGNSLKNSVGYIYDEKHDKYYATVSFDNSSSTFRIETDGSWTKLRGGYGNVVESSDYQNVWDTRKDGEVRTYGVPSGGSSINGLKLLSRALPNGIIWTYTWDSLSGYSRPASVTNNLGYKISLEYLSNTNPTNSDWNFVKTVYFYNLAISSVALKSASRSKNSGIIQIITDGGQTWSVSGNASYDPNFPSLPPFAYKTPSSSSMNFSFQPVKPLSSYHRTTSATLNGLTTNYDFYLLGNSGTTTVNDPLGAQTVVQYTSYTSPWSSTAFPTTVTDSIGNVTAFASTGYIISAVTRPEGDQDVFAYGARTNITLVTHKSKPGSGLADTTESAIFPTACSNIFTCNRPTSYTDRNGKTTSYSYAPEHGGIVTETRPADANGIQAVKRYRYEQRYAWIQNGSGGYMHAGSQVWVKTQERVCRTTATVGDACQGGAGDEVVTTYDYGSDSGPNNLLVRGIVVTADGQSQRTCYTYDSTGNKVSETKPLGTGGSCP
jgi:YD repeat-containing protein